MKKKNKKINKIQQRMKKNNYKNRKTLGPKNKWTLFI